MNPRAQQYEDWQSDVHRLEGCVLIDVNVRTYFVEFVFLDELRITLRLNKRFEFTLSDGVGLSFDPTLELDERGAGDSRFIFLQGRRCMCAVLAPSRFEIEFEDGARLWLEIGDKDFEPFELVGMASNPPEKLLFYYVS